MEEHRLKLLRLDAKNYRSLRHVSISLGSMNVLIGANGSGKSNLLDALRFLSTGVLDAGFDRATIERGGLHMAWKGERAQSLELNTRFGQPDGVVFEWRLTLRFGAVRGAESVEETVHEYREGSPPAELLNAVAGEGSWWSDHAPDYTVNLKLSPSSCALAAASADASFRARSVADFVRGWRFFDPAPLVLRRPGDSGEAEPLDIAGRHLAARLFELQTADPERFKRIVVALTDVVGYAVDVEPQQSEEDGRVFLLLKEPPLRYRVHQIGASSGTLRVLALLTGLLGEDDATLVGIEEPENYIHPTAIERLAEHLRAASARLQVVITTHAPHLLDALGIPEEVSIVTRTDEGTEVRREPNGASVREALEQSGLGLGQLHKSKGFGT